MGIRSLNQLAKLRQIIMWFRRAWLRVRHGVVIDPSSTISLSGRVVSGGPRSIVIGKDTLVAFKTLLVSRDIDGGCRPIRIGDCCFVGGGATVMPGVTIGDRSVVAGGAVVFDDVPPRCMVVGNPARVLRTEIEVGKRGRLLTADDNSRRLWR